MPEEDAGEEEEEKVEEGGLGAEPEVWSVPEDRPWLTKAATLLRMSLQTGR